MMLIVGPAQFQLFVIASMVYSFALVPILLTRSNASKPPSPQRTKFRQLFAISPVFFGPIIGSIRPPYRACHISAGHGWSRLWRHLDDRLAKAGHLYCNCHISRALLLHLSSVNISGERFGRSRPACSGRCWYADLIWDRRQHRANPWYFIDGLGRVRGVLCVHHGC